MSLPRALQFGFFLLVVSLITFGVHRYLWARLVRDPAWSEPWSRVGGWGLVALAALMFVSMPLSRALPRSAGSPLAWAAFTWMGLAFVLLVGTAATDVLRVIAGAVVRGSDPSRRQFFARAIAALVGLVGLGAGGLALRNALQPWRIRTVRVALRGLPEALEGMTLVQLTDVHVGPTIGRPFIEAMVRAVNALNPDAVVITGDLVDGSVAELGHHVAPIAELRARRGVFFVTGNHEYYSGVGEWLAELRRLGVRVLENERVTLGDGDAVIDLAGVHDWSGRRMPGPYKPDLTKALAGRDPTRPVVLLAHQPKHMREAVPQGVSLMLSGHTHGGQIWPWGALVRLDQPYVKGLHREGGTQIYVSEGTGYWGPPMRLGTEPEITRVVLTRA